jgi:L-gulono-1,4-lactone dehydrogenase
MQWWNWARTETARPDRVEAPADPSEVASVLHAAAAAGQRVKAVGSGHSFSGIAVPDTVLLSLEHLRGIESIDRQRARATVASGTPLHELNRLLAVQNLAMPNLGDIDRQTLAGALSTGTHGTGLHLGGLASQVLGLEMVLADGTEVRCSASEDPHLFAAARVGLGALGIVTAVTLQCVESFALRAVEAPAPVDDVLEHFNRLAATNDHFEFYWFPHGERALTKSNNRVPPGTEVLKLGRVRGFVDDELLSNAVFGATNRLGRVVPSTIPPVNRLATRLFSAREYVDASYRVFTSPRRVRFKEMEYALPMAAMRPAFEAVRRWIDRSGERVSFPMEVRVAAADDIWLSTASGRATAYVAVHQYYRTDHRRFFDAAEAILWDAGGRPHWGKMHTRTADQLRTRYAHFDDFVNLRRKVDPLGVFSNAYLDRVLGKV